MLICHKDKSLLFGDYYIYQDFGKESLRFENKTQN